MTALGHFRHIPWLLVDISFVPNGTDPDGRRVETPRHVCNGRPSDSLKARDEREAFSGPSTREMLSRVGELP